MNLIRFAIIITSMNAEKLKVYADLAVKIGVNLQYNQELVIKSDVRNADFVHVLAERAYVAGASKVTIQWNDEVFFKLRCLNETIESVSEIPDFQVRAGEYVIEKKAAYINVLSEDPELMREVNPEIISSNIRSVHRALKKFYDASMKNEIRWTIIAVPSRGWAEKVFPGMPFRDSIENLWQLIFKSMRMDTENPVAEWNKHYGILEKRAEILNSYNFSALHYKNSLGTNVIVGLPENYRFQCCGEKASDGIVFTANMPTEEVYTAPDKRKVNGVIKSSMPLIHNGKRIEGISLTFSQGRIIDYTATKGFEVLKEIIETDEGSHYLGEVALVPFDSPIQNLKTIFYNTIFDENASCHFAIGKAYPYCVKNGENLSEEELDNTGLNSSIEHVDFMVGTEDLEITGITADGRAVEVFRKGNFAV